MRGPFTIFRLHLGSFLAAAFLGSAVLPACSSAKFSGTPKEVSPTQEAAVRPTCPGGVEEVKVELPAELASCWSSGFLIDTTNKQCSSIAKLAEACNSVADITALATSKGFGEPGSVIQEKLNEGGIVIGCGLSAAGDIFYVQMDAAPSIESECKRTIGRKIFSYCIYSASSSYTDTSKCNWP